MLDTFVAPTSTWRPPLLAPARTPSKKSIQEQEPPDWRDYAAEERWGDAIIAFLQADWRQTFKLWTVVNTIVAESQQQTRTDVRAATWECLQEMMRLRRERVIFRYKRKWIAILDNGLPLIPLEDLPKRPATQEHGVADSTRSTF